jgi:hypothetical protein
MAPERGRSPARRWTRLDSSEPAVEALRSARVNMVAPPMARLKPRNQTSERRGRRRTTIRRLGARLLPHPLPQTQLAGAAGADFVELSVQAGEQQGKVVGEVSVGDQSDGQCAGVGEHAEGDLHVAAGAVDRNDLVDAGL